MTRAYFVCAYHYCAYLRRHYDRRGDPCSLTTRGSADHHPGFFFIFSFAFCGAVSFLFLLPPYTPENIFGFHRTFDLACEACLLRCSKIPVRFVFPPLYASESRKPKTCFLTHEITKEHGAIDMMWNLLYRWCLWLCTISYAPL